MKNAILYILLMMGISPNLLADEIIYEFDDTSFDTGFVNPFNGTEIRYEDLSVDQIRRLNELALEKYNYALALSLDEISQLDSLAQDRINAIRTIDDINDSAVYETIVDFLAEVDAGEYDSQYIELYFAAGLVQFYADVALINFGGVVVPITDTGNGPAIRSVYELATMALAAEDNELNIQLVNPGIVDPSTGLVTLQIEFLCPDSVGLSVDEIEFETDAAEILPVNIVQDVQFVGDEVDEKGYRTCDIIAAFPILEETSGVLRFSIIDAFGVIYSYVSGFTYGVIIGNTADSSSGDSSQSSSTDLGSPEVNLSSGKNGLMGCSISASSTAWNLHRLFFAMLVLSGVVIIGRLQRKRVDIRS